MTSSEERDGATGDLTDEYGDLALRCARERDEQRRRAEAAEGEAATLRVQVAALAEAATDLLGSIRCSLGCNANGWRSPYCSACGDSTEDHDCPPLVNCEHTALYRKALGLRAALGDPGPWVDRIKTEGAREVLDKVQAVYDTQCPVGPERNFVASARMAHQWWETVLGGLLDDERARVLRDGGDHGAPD